MVSPLTRMFGFAACAVSLLLLVGALVHGAMARPAGAATTVAPPPALTDAWVRLSAVSGRPAAGYFTLTGTARDRLIAVSSPRAARIELHSMSISPSKVMQMNVLPAVSIRPGATVAFAPGGNHLMIFDLDPAFKPGEPLPLTFAFASGAKLTVEARTVAAGTDAPMAKAHDH